MIVTSQDLFSFLQHKQDIYQEIWLPAQAVDSGREVFYYRSLLNGQHYELNGHRAVDPIKVFYYRFREQVFPVPESRRTQLLLGVKACDLRGLAVLDRALLTGSSTDPAYALWRESTTIISADCTTLAPSCHCILVDGRPYAETGFDVNLSRLDDSFLLTEGSKKGRAFLDLLKGKVSYTMETPEQRDNVNQNREEMVRQLHEQNKRLFRSDEYERMRTVEAEVWEEFASTCVGCGACTNICPTCYCLILNDETSDGEFTKVRCTDSCQLHGYARVAGGGTPRPYMTQRVRHRYLCKYTVMPREFNLLGCTGCGRCIDACPGNIEFRQVIQAMMARAEEKIVATEPVLA